MSKCPICYKELLARTCDCGLDLTTQEMLQLKADVYDDIIKHLHESGADSRRREQIRTKIALRSIKKWAEARVAKG